MYMPNMNALVVYMEKYIYSISFGINLNITMVNVGFFKHLFVIYVQFSERVAGGVRCWLIGNATVQILADPSCIWRGSQSDLSDEDRSPFRHPADRPARDRRIHHAAGDGPLPQSLAGA